MNRLSKKFENFSIIECRGSSALYERLSMNIANDKELLKIASYARDGQPVPNLFLAAVQYLLLKGKDHELSEFYPSIVDVPRENIEDVFSYFKDFCKTYEKDIIRILKERLVQTNEVRRCAYLYPVFAHIFHIVRKPLALIEIGTSAGFQLFWDKYCYSYGDSQIYGEKESNVHITSKITSENTPILYENSPPVSTRIGIDLHINDLTNSDDYLWLKALIWPNHHERRILFDKAANYVMQHEKQFIEGDGVNLLPEIVKEIPTDNLVCIFHTHVANQLSLKKKFKLLKEVESISKDRDVFHIYNNMNDGDLHLDYFLNEKKYSKRVGKTDGHGRWFSWELEN